MYIHVGKDISDVNKFINFYSQPDAMYFGFENLTEVSAETERTFGLTSLYTQ